MSLWGKGGWQCEFEMYEMGEGNDPNPGVISSALWLQAFSGP